MTVPQGAIDLIKRFEGCRLQAYKCPAGVWTCGWGAVGEGIEQNVIWTQAAADHRLATDLVKFTGAVDHMVRVRMTPGQRAALISLAFNIGSVALRESTLLQLLNAGKYAAAGTQFARWNKGGGKVLPGLVARRAAEAASFMEGVEQ